MKNLLFTFSFVFVTLFVFSVVPHPIFANQINLTNQAASQINDYHESEISPQTNQQTKILSLKWKQGINNLFPIGQEFDIVLLDCQTTISMERIGGKRHFDILPTNTQSKEILSQISTNPSTKLPVLAKINNQTYLPASLYAYSHGYDNHYCLHFKDSKTDGTKKEDAAHQKNISHIIHNQKNLLSKLKKMQ